MAKNLPKAYEPQKYEDKIYKKWEKSGCFQPKADRKDSRQKSYTISLPPPNRTGTLHVGHALMLAAEDILIRYHRMKGDRTLWVPGTDHAAIATQAVVEKKIYKESGKSRHDLGRKNFLKKVHEFADESHKTITNQVKKMGSSLDWSREAYTLDETRNKAVNTVFKMMYNDGLIYRGERIVNWCPRCHSTLSDDEVEYKKEKGKLYWLKYGPFVLATARPETKLGDTAVAVHPQDKRYKKMVGKKYMIPGVLGEFEIKVVADRAVDMKFGSGAIKVTPAHSFVDNEIASRHNIGMRRIIDEDGRMMKNCGKYAGLTTKEARKKIVADMEKMGLIERIDEGYEHNVALCYRCATPIEPLPSRQWFIDVNKKITRYKKSLKELSVEAVRKGVFGKDKIKIVPERFEKNYFHWMDNLRDWCISRQIWFGHRIPAWYCMACNDPKVKHRIDSEGNVAKTDVMLNRKSSEAIISIEKPKECPECHAKDQNLIIQDPDTLDTWFSSGLWTFSTLAQTPDQISIKNGKLHIDSDDFRNFHPTSVLETGYDILFFWVARMIIMTTYAVGDIPFQDVYLHGLIRDEKGRKMSKSLGNVIDPLDMVKKYGADATRLSLIIGTTPGNDMKLSEEKVAGYRNFVNKLWNVARYILQNYELRITNYELDQKKLTAADYWILQKMFVLINLVTEDLNNYQFSQAGEKLREFTWNDLADWYLEASKFEKTEEKEKILTMILTDLLKLWHPFIPFVTEAIWKELGFGDLLMISKWPDVKNYPKKYPRHSYGGFESIAQIIKAIRAIHDVRTKNDIESAKKIKAVIYVGSLTNPSRARNFFELHTELIKNLKTGIKELEISEKKPKLNDVTLSISVAYVPVRDIIIYLFVEADKKKEKARIEKEIKNLENLIKNTEKKLANKEFVSKAPKKIVKREKNNLKMRISELKKLKDKLLELK